MTSVSLDGFSPRDLHFHSRVQPRYSLDMNKSSAAGLRKKSSELDHEISTEESAAPFKELFDRFCWSSSIHGTYFWIGSNTTKAKVSWFIIVIMGIIMAIWIINNSFKAWREHPVVTSVMQKSIEEIHFPAITICPMDDTRYNLVHTSEYCSDNFTEPRLFMFSRSVSVTPQPSGSATATKSKSGKK